MKNVITFPFLLFSLLFTVLFVSACNAPDNNKAEASFTVQGEFKEGQTVVMDVDITDNDGLTDAQFVYAWFQDNVLIANNSSETLSLTYAQIGSIITFNVSFEDDLGNNETLTTEPYTVVERDNIISSATFDVVGEFKEEQSVVMSANISDNAGVDNAQFLYAWYQDGTLINNNTTDTLNLTYAQIGASITFKVSFTDDRGNDESVTSQPFTVVERDNNISDATFDVVGLFQETQTVSITANIIDSDGFTNATFTYAWYVNDQLVNQNSGNTFTFDDTHIGQIVYFTLTFNDDRGNNETITSDNYNVVIMDNRPAQVEFNFSADFEEQQTVVVTPNVTDADGTDNISFQYAWYADSQLLDNETSNQITFTPADNGKSIYFILSFTDDRNHVESVTSDTFIVQNKTELIAFASDAYDLFIGHSANTNADDWVWSGAVNPVKLNEVSDSYKEFYYPHAATDNKGNIIVVMQSEYYEAFGGEYDVVYSYSNDNGVTFSPVDLLDQNDITNSNSDDHIRIATDSNGYWLAIWDTREDLNGLGGSDDDIVYAISTDNGQSFSTPQSIADLQFSDSVNDRMADISMTKNIWTAVWTTRNDLTQQMNNDEDIAYSYTENKGITWSDPAYVNDFATSDSTTDYFPQIAMNSSGFAVSVWASSYNADNLNIYAASSQDFGKTWAPAILINQYAATDAASNNDYPNDVMVSEDNIAIISWDGDNPLMGADEDVYYSVSTNLGMSWSVEKAMNLNADTDSDDHQSLTITQTPDGKWIAVYNNYTSQSAYLRKSDDLETWTNPELLKDSVYYYPSILFH